MSNTAIFILIAIVAVAGIFWLVIYAKSAWRDPPAENYYQTARFS